MDFFMKKLLTLIAVAGSLNVCHAQFYTSTLTSQQEVPVGANHDSTTYNTGAAADLSLNGSTLTVSEGVFGNLLGEPNPVSGVTIDVGLPGVQGSALFNVPVAFEFAEGGGLFFGSFGGSVTLTGTEISELNSGDLYLNITTPTQNPITPGGEVRGQITSVPEPATMTLMGVGSMAWLAMRRKKG
jgi:hypothetical protein